MDGRLRINRAIKVLSEYNNRQLGMHTLRNIVSIYITSSPKGIVDILETLRGVGVLTEVSPFQFMVNTNVDIAKVVETIEFKKDNDLELWNNEEIKTQ